MKNYKNNQRGLIKLIIIIIIAIAVLSWYGVDIKKFFTSEQALKNFGYIWTYIKEIWSEYLEVPAQKLWVVWLDHIWGPFMDLIGKGGKTDVSNP